MEPTRTSIQAIGPERAERLKAIIMSHVSIEDRGYIEPCWRSTRKVRKDGFTQTTLDGKQWQTHRLAYMLFVGDIPPLMKLAHKCGLNSCFNPAHLTLTRSVKPVTVLPTDGADKVCIRCKEAKPKGRFGVDRYRGDGLSAYCKDCVSAYARKSYHSRTPDEQTRHKERHEAWQRANKDKVASMARRHILKKKYGLTFAEYEAMLAAQGNECAICGASDGRNGKSFHVDHCHKTGAVRGILCSTCNVSIGGLKDNPALLRRAAHYLESTRGKA